ncbi:MAG: hypothetical protein JO257_26320 [Deltaproteobacteria bacterium]|nr:hypothetical protein [Deltaproteobacteria bacterium]
MRSLFVFLIFAGCVASHPTPTEHRVASQTCTASAGDSNGSDECLSDADCASGGVCSCAGKTFEYAHATRNICVQANCRTDADCTGGYLCSPSNADGGPFYGVQGYYCHTPHDQCTVDSECNDNGRAGYCMFAPEVGHWACGYNFAAG